MHDQSNAVHDKDTFHNLSLRCIFQSNFVHVKANIIHIAVMLIILLKQIFLNFDVLTQPSLE